MYFVYPTKGFTGAIKLKVLLCWINQKTQILRRPKVSNGVKQYDTQQSLDVTRKIQLSREP